MRAVEFFTEIQMPKNSYSIPLSILPKRIPCRTLIVSLHANQETDYQAVDLSQLEDRELAHFIIGRTQSLKEMMGEYLEQNDDQEEREWMEGEMRQYGDSDLYSALIGRATLLYYEDLGVWSFEI